jgi:hypothetical protein
VVADDYGYLALLGREPHRYDALLYGQ